MTKEKVKVIWFNKNKGFGEGETGSGEVVFLHYKALQSTMKSLSPGQYIFCELTIEDGRPTAFSIEKAPTTQPDRLPERETNLT